LKAKCYFLAVELGFCGKAFGVWGITFDEKESRLNNAILNKITAWSI
jgi:hypothetical protein